MPLYEYYCTRCDDRFDLLRPAGRMDDPAECPQGHPGGERVLSIFAARTGGDADEPHAIPAAARGCACAAGGSCACSLN